MTILFECNITSNKKYYIYHCIVFAQFILTILQISRLGYDKITGFILSTIIIQILLCCCINTDNRIDEVTTCSACFVGYSNFANICIILYLFIKLESFKEITEGKLHGIYLVGLVFYVFVVLVMINPYYLSASKFRECYCICYKPKGPDLPTITLPTITLPEIPKLSEYTKSIKVNPNKECLVCYNKKDNMIRLTCGHYLCQTCLDGIRQVDSAGHKLCPWCRQAIILGPSL